MSRSKRGARQQVLISMSHMNNTKSHFVELHLVHQCSLQVSMPSLYPLPPQAIRVLCGAMTKMHKPPIEYLACRVNLTLGIPKAARGWMTKPEKQTSYTWSAHQHLLPDLIGISTSATTALWSDKYTPSSNLLGSIPNVENLRP